MAADNKSLGKFMLDDIPPARAACRKSKSSLTSMPTGIRHVSAPRTRHRQGSRICPTITASSVPDEDRRDVVALPVFMPKRTLESASEELTRTRNEADSAVIARKNC